MILITGLGVGKSSPGVPDVGLMSPDGVVSSNDGLEVTWLG